MCDFFLKIVQIVCLIDRRVLNVHKGMQTRKIRNFGGDEENRTPDPLLARQVLSQLSYTPKFS